jgi:hypothetical protein
MSRFWLVAMAGLAGCTALRTPTSLTQTTLPRTPDACEKQADQLPDVVAIRMKILGNLSVEGENQAPLAAALRRGTIACLQSRGIVAPGGVEAPRQDRSLFNGLGI